MKFLVVGLGSMGKRRIRNLKAIGYDEIAGIDAREDRCDEAKKKYGVEVYSDFYAAVEKHNPDALVISTSPDSHMEYAEAAFKLGLSCFIEASVVHADKILELHELTKTTSVIFAPSCTMRYFPGPKKIKELLESGAIGKPLNINYHVGQYLPDWHPWENIEEFYVSKRETGGCREIVPFELTWLNGIFGVPTALACVKSKLTDINADIDDIYHCLMCYPEHLMANITIDVISRPSVTRELRILGSDGEIVFNGDDETVRIATLTEPGWKVFELNSGSVEPGYVYPEEPYISEMQDFVNAVKNKDRNIFPNTLFDDYQVLQTLYQLESLSEDNI